METYEYNEETMEEMLSDDDLKLDHIPDVRECRALRRQFQKEGYWPNVWHINDHGNADLLSIGWNGAKIIRSWV
jgi:hypothetical protein